MHSMPIPDHRSVRGGLDGTNGDSSSETDAIWDRVVHLSVFGQVSKRVENPN